MGPAASSDSALGLSEMVMPPRKKANDFERGNTRTGTPEYSVKFYDTRKPSEQSLELQERESFNVATRALTDPHKKAFY